MKEHEHIIERQERIIERQEKVIDRQDKLSATKDDIIAKQEATIARQEATIARHEKGMQDYADLLAWLKRAVSTAQLKAETLDKKSVPRELALPRDRLPTSTNPRPG